MALKYGVAIFISAEGEGASYNLKSFSANVFPLGGHKFQVTNNQRLVFECNQPDLIHRFANFMLDVFTVPTKPVTEIQDEPEVKLITWGKDLLRLRAYCKRNGIPLPKYFSKTYDLQEIYQNAYGGKGYLADAFGWLGMQSNPTSAGIKAASDLAKLCQILTSDPYKLSF